jgi:ADP-ribosylglycohydrolase
VREDDARPERERRAHRRQRRRDAHSAVLGAALVDDDDRRRRLARQLACVTHTDARAVEGAAFIAELAALFAKGRALDDVLTGAIALVEDAEVASSVSAALALARSTTSIEDAARQLGVTGFVVHTVGFATFLVVRFADDPFRAMQEACAAGGDTDTIAAIVGGLAGARHGVVAPGELVDRLVDGPFGKGHLRALARAFVENSALPRASFLLGLLRTSPCTPSRSRTASAGWSRFEGPASGLAVRSAPEVDAR